MQKCLNTIKLKKKKKKISSVRSAQKKLSNLTNVHWYSMSQTWVSHPPTLFPVPLEKIQIFTFLIPLKM